MKYCNITTQYPIRFGELEVIEIPLIMLPTFTPIPLLTSPLKGEEPCPLPFKGRVGMGLVVQIGDGGKQ